MIRTLRDEVERYGPYSLAVESKYDHPMLWGSKRTGPDLARIGGKYSDEWHVAHLVNPRDVVPQSVMPSYARLLRNALRTDDLGRHLRAMRAVGVPYTDEMIANAARRRRRPGHARQPARRGRRQALRRGDQRARLRRRAGRAHRDGRAGRLPADPRPPHRRGLQDRATAASEMTMAHDDAGLVRQDLRPVLPDRAVGGRARLRLLAVEQEEIRPRRRGDPARTRTSHGGRGARPPFRLPDDRPRVERHQGAQHAGAAAGLSLSWP